MWLGCLELQRISVRAKLGTQLVQLLPAREALGLCWDGVGSCEMSGYRLEAAQRVCPGVHRVPWVPGQGGGSWAGEGASLFARVRQGKHT